MIDPYGTAALRAAVLDAWAASPTRFREDANAEEDLRLGGYAHTWFVELAQNAADAARAAGVPGRLRVTVDGDELRVANTGAPLDAAGVAALASLRASAKREGDSVGRFGVGFAAVLALSDAPRVVSAGNGVAFSATRTAAAVAHLPGVAAELARRGGQLPVLRLAWPVEPTEPAAPEGYDTEVRLPLRPGLDAVALLVAARGQAADLLLALPGLVEIAVGGTVLARADGPGGEVGIAVDGDVSRWLLARRTGAHAPADVAALAAEQQTRATWSVTWALPLPLPAARTPTPTPHLGPLTRSTVAVEQHQGSKVRAARAGGAAGAAGVGVGVGGVGEVLHAPTPTAE
ncbi:MAG: sacsin N-terminal ATP-binding-like domain-containing protein, partial [Pseudonocardia sp.]